MITSNPMFGTTLHGVGAFVAACCYAPQKKVKRWSWQTFWIAQAAFCWLLWPIFGAMLTIPQLGAVLAEAPKRAMAHAFLLGMAYGIGGTAFGLSIRYIGFALTYSLAIGISSVLGTLIPPLLAGTIVQTFHKMGSGWVMAGVGIGTLGTILCGWAGRSKELDLGGQAAQRGFSLARGLPLCLLAGVLSAVYGIALEAGGPIADVAESHGAGYFRGNVVYIFANSGAFLTTGIYCLYLGLKNRTLGELVKLPSDEGQLSLPLNFIFAMATGTLWYGQFFFYNLAHVRMGQFKFTSWAIHMILLVLFSNAIGIVFKEWKGCRPRTHWAITAALVVLTIGVLTLTYGNYLGEMAVKR